MRNILFLPFLLLFLQILFYLICESLFLPPRFLYSPPPSKLSSTTPLFGDMCIFCGNPVGVLSKSLAVRFVFSVLQSTGGDMAGVSLSRVSSVGFTASSYLISAVMVNSGSMFAVLGNSSARDDWLSDITVYLVVLQTFQLALWELFYLRSLIVPVVRNGFFCVCHIDQRD